MVQNIQISGGDEITKKSETSQTALEFGGEIKKKKKLAKFQGCIL